jgi:hypothetical protein
VQRPDHLAGHPPTPLDANFCILSMIAAAPIDFLPRNLAAR